MNPFALIDRALAWPARGLVLIYRHTLSSIMGRHCRYLPTCSEYADNAFRLHGFWAGGWMALARVQRCRPGGGDGFDPVPNTVRPEARWWAPWRYGVWRLDDSPTGD